MIRYSEEKEVSYGGYIAFRYNEKDNFIYEINYEEDKISIVDLTQEQYKVSNGDIIQIEDLKRRFK